MTNAVTPETDTSTTDGAGHASRPVPIAVAHGDGIGPDIMEATLFLLKEAGASLDISTIEVGESVYQRGNSAGIDPGSWDILRHTGILLKAPITTPRGKGYKSLNVTIRKTLGLFANVRPCQTYHPFISAIHPGMDVVIIRENEEDTYGGIEHRQTAEVTQCLKLISQPGSDKVIRYAFEYARQHGRKKMTCFVKDNIMKITDGLFHSEFDRIAQEYDDIEAETWIIDIGSAKLAKDPKQFDVIVLPNLYGDIVSDIAAEVAGSIGIAGSANIGDHCAMFEAVHGSAPDIAGKGIANPSGLLHAGILMLDHVGETEAARRLHNAWLCTIEDGVMTGDMRAPNERDQAVGTEAFAKAVAERLGKEPNTLPVAIHRSVAHSWEHEGTQTAHRPKKDLVGVDVFVDWTEAGRDPNVLGNCLRELGKEPLTLRMITNRGTKVFPEGHPETFCTDHWRCRFINEAGTPVTHQQVIELLNRLAGAGFDFIKTEHLYHFDGERGFSLGQGE